MQLCDRGEPASPPQVDPFNFSRWPSGTFRLRWSSFYSPHRLQLSPPNDGSKFYQLIYIIEAYLSPAAKEQLKF